MKIAMATFYWHSRQGGGINTHIVELVNALKQVSKNNDIQILYIDGKDDRAYKIRTGRLRIIWDSYGYLKKIQPDIINVRESKPLLFSAALYRIFHKNVKLFFSFHTEPTPAVSVSEKIKKIFRKIPFQWGLNKCNRVLFISTGMENQLVKNLGIKIKTKKGVIQPGIKTTIVKPEEISEFKNKFSIKEDSILLLIHGFTAYGLKAEGVKLIMRSFKKLIKKYPNLVLILTREGIYTNELRDYAKRCDVFDHIIFTGDLSKPSVPLELCDIFIWPWLGEMGVGMSLLEAMSKGKPILATSVYGTQELIKNKETGLLVKANEREIINGISRLIEDNELKQKLGTNAKQTVINDFTWEKAAKKHLELFGAEN